ncbi:hypothetical protein [Nocardioides solisilvae]|uniref:hypothetical protein n=1 Tax=Nocardioides solisilvae TaxID=1542435 RepID=UPI000D74FFAC|nr:hypothetical protein [Nocardioides solisilvae]
MTLSIHGPLGVLDLVVPAGATAHDVARAYAAESGLGSIPLVQTPLGELVVADRPLVEAGLESGDVLVAVTGFHRGRAKDRDQRPAETGRSGALPVVAMTAAALCAVLAGWFASYADFDDLRWFVAAILLATGLAAALPGGRHAHQRTVAAPAFAVGATYAVLAAEGLYQAPAVVAACALAAAAVAAFARALGGDDDEELLVWMVVGAVVAVVCATVVLLELSDLVAWSVLVLLAMLATRVAPSMAVDVPDEALLDLEKLAVTAWSARERVKGRRGRIVVPEARVRELVARGSRTVTASAAAVLAVLGVAVPQLVASAEVDLDVIGVRCLLFFAGGAVLLAARSYRHAAARTLLRLAGLWAWLLLVVELLAVASPSWQLVLLGTAVGLGAISLAAAVATGRGWRSVWWARRAEVAETLCGSFGIAATVVASGLFRFFWEMNS